jgi:hypothetical protein
MHEFNHCVNKCKEELSYQLFNSSNGENSIIIDNNVVSHFPERVNNGLEYSQNDYETY